MFQILIRWTDGRREFSWHPSRREAVKFAKATAGQPGVARVEMRTPPGKFYVWTATDEHLRRLVYSQTRPLFED